MEDWKDNKLEEISKNLEKKEIFFFDELSDYVKNLHSVAYSSAVKAINRFATIRNFLIGFYIVEYEQNGMDNNLFVSTYKLTLPDPKVLEEFLLNELENEGCV